MTKQEILDQLRQWRDKVRAKVEAADAAVEACGPDDDHAAFKREADRLYYQWKGLRNAINEIVEVEEEQP